MVRLFQEILHIYAQYLIFFLTIAQLLIFSAMGSLFRGKRDAAPRYIAGVLQLFVINGIAWYSAFFGLVAFFATYALSFVWYYKSAHNMLDEMEAEENVTSAASEGSDGTTLVDGAAGGAETGEVDSMDSAEKY